MILLGNEIDQKRLSILLTKRLGKHPLWVEIVKSVVLPNVGGKVWLIGGTVSRVLCEELYGTRMEGFDFDFTCERLNKRIVCPLGGTVDYVKFDKKNPTFTKGSESVDIFPLSDQEWIRQRHLSPSIDNLFAGVPFTIQAMAYNIEEKQVVGDRGIAALLKREFKVNNIEMAQNMAKRKGTSVDERMKSKAKSMGFAFVPIGK